MKKHNKRYLIVSLSSFVALATTLSIILMYAFVWGRSVLEKHLFTEPRTPINLPHQNQSQEYINAIRDFSITLNRVIEEQEDNENYVFSPVSVANNLYMLYEISEGTSKNRIKTLLNIDDTVFNHVDEVAKTIENNLHNVIDNKGRGHIISNVSQALLCDNHFVGNLDSTYLDILSNKYYSETYSADFSSDIINDIQNEYFNKKTESHYSLNTSSINHKTDGKRNVSVMGTTYLDVNWHDSFFPSRYNTFTNYDGSTRNNLNYFLQEYYLELRYIYEGDDYIISCLDFLGYYAIYFLIPNLNSDYKQVLADNYHNLINLSGEKQYLASTLWSIPEFKCSSNYDFSDLLKDNALSNNASLDGINHFAGIDINDYGLVGMEIEKKGKEETLVAYGSDVPYLTICVDRPFMFAVMDVDGLPLLTGRVLKL